MAEATCRSSATVVGSARARRGDRSFHIVIASGAKQSRVPPQKDSGLLRSARNDGCGNRSSVVQLEPLELPVQRGAADAEDLGCRRNVAARAEQCPLQHRALTAGEVVVRGVAAEKIGR